MRIAIVDTGSGNLASVLQAVEKAAENAEIAVRAVVTTSVADVRAADRIILPGQGAFAAVKRGLDALPDMQDALDVRVRAEGVPFFGICVGMQILFERGLEHGVSFGLGWFQGQVAPMDPKDKDGKPLPLPQMGWNALDFVPGHHKLLDGVTPGDHVYFVHSYALVSGNPSEAIASTDYGGPVVAMVASGNRAGTQFHVEKSQEVGIRILGNFLCWSP
ncbi:MAG TPA: imidazole glycerol phosphate synthase subunit HisH [Roseomonas sp.]